MSDALVTQFYIDLSYGSSLLEIKNTLLKGKSSNRMMKEQIHINTIHTSTICYDDCLIEQM